MNIWYIKTKYFSDLTITCVTHIFHPLSESTTSLYANGSQNGIGSLSEIQTLNFTPRSLSFIEPSKWFLGMLMCFCFFVCFLISWQTSFYATYSEVADSGILSAQAARLQGTFPGELMKNGFTPTEGVTWPSHGIDQGLGTWRRAAWKIISSQYS